ncbi:MAG: TIGR04282 family arsenosugar biosynthesis glycosyltransferase [Saprospiraceae bacterium]
MIFIKNPVLGKVKTRLAKTVGDQKALTIYKFLLRRCQNITSNGQFQKHLFYSDFVDDLDDWSPDIYVKHLQQGDDLGNRMEHAFERVFELSHNESSTITKTIIIGSDCPDITPNIIEKAFVALDQHDIVIGPTFDGGYYLLGMKKFNHQIFRDIVWSSDSVFTATTQKADQLLLSYFLLDTLNDVDDEEDWNQFEKL